MERGAEKRRDTRLPVPGASSAVVVGLDYSGAEPPGPVARYARGDYYHHIMLRKLRELQRWIGREVGGLVRGRCIEACPNEARAEQLSYSSFGLGLPDTDYLPTSANRDVLPIYNGPHREALLARQEARCTTQVSWQDIHATARLA